MTLIKFLGFENVVVTVILNTVHPFFYVKILKLTVNFFYGSTNELQIKHNKHFGYKI